MVVEYSIKFEKDGVIIRQRLEPGQADNPWRSVAPANTAPGVTQLGPSYEESTGPGTGPEQPTGPGGSGGGPRTVAVFGPIVVSGSAVS
jgi:hypothetical protein